MQPDERPIGIVGLGKIGGAVAKHILASGRPMIAWARRPEALTDFVAQGGIAAQSPADLGTANVVISVVFDDAGTREVVLGPSGFIDAMPAGSTHIAMATISPALSRTLHTAHAERGQKFLAAPVFGRPEVAARGELAIMCSGAEDTFRAVEPILATAGTPRWVGPEPEQAMLVKLIGNQMIYAMVQVLRETFAFLSAGGIGRPQTKATLLDSLMPGIFAGYAQRIADRPDGPLPGSTAVGRKDIQLVLEAARDLSVDLPLARFLCSDVIKPQD